MSVFLHLHKVYRLILTHFLDGDPDYCCPRCCPPPPPRIECCDVCNPALANFLYDKMDKPKRPPRQPASTPLNEDDSGD